MDTGAVVNEAPGTAPLRLSRRHVLGLTAAAAAGVATAHAAPATAEGSLPAGVAADEVEAEGLARTGGTARTRPSATSRTAALHLIRRATYGPTPRLVADVRSRGTSAWLERQLRPASIPDPVGSTLRSLYPEAGWSIPQVYRAVGAGRIQEYSWDVMIPLGQYTVAMATWSSRQLFEVMVEFWSNHLNVANTSDGVWDNRQDYDRRVIRGHALGRFSDMLTASASHPAMLEYLNQAESTKDAPNENYGRELLELHTVGVGAGYSEAMVVDSARIMTGHTIRWDERSRHHREFVYDPSVHWTGRVRVLSFSDRNARADGRPVAQAYLRYLAHHPSTARNIARKLAVRFVSDSPSDALVNRLAAVYLAHDTSTVPVLRALFGSAEFAASSGAKVRRPYEDLVATLRALDYRLLPGSAGATRRRSGPEALYWTASDLGQAPLAWAPPNGYPDAAAAWGSAGGLVGRWNMHQGLAGGWWPAKDRIVVPDLRAMVPRRLTTYRALIDALATRLTGEPLPDNDTATVLTFLGRSPDAHVGVKDPAVTWDLVRTVGVLLDTANHQLR